MTEKEFKTKVCQLKELKQSIEFNIYHGKYDEAKKLLRDYESNFNSVITICTTKAAIYVIEGNLEQAEKVLLNGLMELPFNYEVSYNLGMVYAFKGQFTKSIEFYFKALKYADSKEKKDMCIESIENLSETIAEKFPGEFSEFKDKFQSIKNKLQEIDARSFPLDGSKESLVGRFINDEITEGHYVNLYKIESFTEIVPQLRTLYKTEMLQGQIINKEIEMEVKEEIVLPISVKKLYSYINLKINNREYKINDVRPNIFYYLPIREEGKLTISSNNEFFLGNTIKIKDKVIKDKPKLILYLFLDGLSQEAIEGNKLKNLMPKTYNFFNDGLKFNSCYCNSEWTLPGLATFFTGKYTTNHKLFHSNWTYKIGSNEKLMSEIFKENGYFTTQICNDWRKTPLYGYNKGFDRTVYQPAIDGMGCEEVVMEAIEHLEAFKEKNNFMWLSFGDLHKVPDNIEPRISSQIKGSLYSRTTEQDNDETVFKSYDDKKIERYETEIERLDFYLGILYNYINSLYSKDEVLILLVSDHGQTFLKKDNGFLHEGRTRVPLLIKGLNTETKNIEDIIENVDVLPMVLNFANINYDLDIDGKLPSCLDGNYKREYAYTESIFPGQTYKAAINDCTHRFMFESESFVENDGRVDVENFNVSLIHKETGLDEKDKLQEKVEKYLEVVFNHIKKNIKI
ncbi:tetratricopeptide repeat protein [Clostridium tetani]|uniref:Sulfatase-domain-containing protein n=1 Tax=Clostridium tetani (strain Massachusetts / E88) TaxID=212717 RepID=Q893V2_CLOTE|nr:sulfatase-like hydrolase/transferase [Clostridium tetani]AAO36240.1 sulfatase-domain-containing protein [Clostridium tetani E88]KGI37800.1 sulfatase [Clostridium tetani]KGI45479.1 sulfatase [Clostridium tetani]KHO31774.1 sulfatase [Clostridium tetani]KIG22060.1 sulfatase [Clostridium tetani]